VTGREARIDMETAGTVTRGRTVVETRAAKVSGFNGSYAAEIDVEKARDTILETLKAEATW